MNRHLKRVPSAFFLVLTGAMLAGSARSVSAQEIPASPASVSAPNNQFGFDLLKNLAARDKDSNLFFSPLSVSSALAITYAGSRGETRRQLAEVLHITGSDREVLQEFHSLNNAVSQAPNSEYHLRVANAVWLQQGIPLAPGYVSLLSRFHPGGLRTVDLRQTQRAIATINHWVSQRTNGRISDVLQPGDIDDKVGFLLMSAIEFVGEWNTAFDEAFTQLGIFITSDGKHWEAPMMEALHMPTRYAEFGNLQALELPYRGNDLSMLVLLPKAQSPEAQSPEAWTEFDINDLQQLRNQMAERDVEVYLPKFKVEARLSLTEDLSQMGMAAAFDSRKADFSGMTNRKPTYLTVVLHEAVIDVNEKRTEAWAGTVAAGVPGGISLGPPPPHPVFRADHPFVYMIIHNRTNAVLFMGRLSKPPQSVPAASYH